jgi:superoxide dismutase, Cu-Zn family
MKTTASTLLAFVLLVVYSLNAQVTQTKQKTTKADAKSAPHAGHEEPPLPNNAVCVLMPTKGHDVQGTIMLTQKAGGVQVIGEVRGLTPGKHGFHIHQFGDLRSDDGMSAGGHYNPENNPHAGPHDAKRHAGDLGNITADQDGKAMVNIMMDGLKVHFAIGRSIVVHAKEDDLKSQPSGDAGARAAVGVIGVASDTPAGSTTTAPTGAGTKKTKS